MPFLKVIAKKLCDRDWQARAVRSRVKIGNQRVGEASPDIIMFKPVAARSLFLSSSIRQSVHLIAIIGASPCYLDNWTGSSPKGIATMQAIAILRIKFYIITWYEEYICECNYILYHCIGSVYRLAASSTSKAPQVKTTEPMVSIKVPNCSIHVGWILTCDGFAKNYMGLARGQNVRFFHLL